jgi:hypothetical protein
MSEGEVKLFFTSRQAAAFLELPYKTWQNAVDGGYGPPCLNDQTRYRKWSRGDLIAWAKTPIAEHKRQADLRRQAAEDLAKEPPKAAPIDRVTRGELEQTKPANVAEPAFGPVRLIPKTEAEKKATAERDRKLEEDNRRADVLERKQAYQARQEVQEFHIENGSRVYADRLEGKDKKAPVYGNHLLRQQAETQRLLSVYREDVASWSVLVLDQIREAFKGVATNLIEKDLVIIDRVAALEGQHGMILNKLDQICNQLTAALAIWQT